MADEERAWAVIEASRVAAGGKGGREQAAALRRLAADWTDEEVLDLERVLTVLMFRAYTWQLWAAAELANQGCSDDGFTDFRQWLIGRGRASYTSALAEPDELAAIIPEGEPTVLVDNPVCLRALLDARGVDISEADVRDAIAAAGLSSDSYGRAEPRGTPRSQDPDGEGDLRRRYPRLYARFGAEPPPRHRASRG